MVAIKRAVKSEVAGFVGFLSRKNLLDVAVGMILGTAFARLAESLVSDLVSPVMSAVLPRGFPASLDVVLRRDSDGNPVRLRVGAFLESASTFLIQSLVLFLFLRHVARRDV